MTSNKNDIFLGSPLLALTRGAGFTDYRFVELDMLSAEALEKRSISVKKGATLKVYQGDCNQEVSKIVNEIQAIDVPPFSKTDWNSYSLVFLDPEGLELNWDTVRQIALLRRADLVINFSIGGLRRNAEQALALQPGTTQVDRFFGTMKWREIPINPDGTMPAQEWIELYQSHLSTLGYKYWGTPVSVKNSRNVEMYRLLFVTKDELGTNLWEKARKGGPAQPPLPGL